MDHRLELRTLTELARLRNARRTADALGVSQSTVSEIVARLERSYGTRLFDRGRQGSVPTATGAVVIAAARRSLEVLDNAEREVALLEGFVGGVLSVAAHPALVETYLVPVVAAVLRSTEHLNCRILSAGPDDLLEGLRNQRLELFVGLEPDGPYDDLVVEPIGTYQSQPFCRDGHPLADLPPQGVKVLREYPMVTTESPRWYTERKLSNVPFTRTLADEISAHGRAVQVANLATMVELVTSTDALGSTMPASIQRHIDDGSLVLLGVPDEERALLAPAPIVIVTIKGRALPPMARAILEELRRIGQRTFTPRRPFANQPRSRSVRDG